MPWPAVPFSNELACNHIEHLSNKLARSSLPCHWVILSNSGEILLQHEPDHYVLSRTFFNFLGGADCPLSQQEHLRLAEEDNETLDAKTVINLNQLLATPSRDFLLTKDGNKVPVSSLEDKVVGLYLCDNPTPSRMEVINKVYREALDLGYNFEIVQINFHFPNMCEDQKLCIEDLPMEPCCENIPWLILPFKDICCRRVRRIFKTYYPSLDMTNMWSGDQLIIINPPEPNISGFFFDTRGADMLQHFGIEAYPFTRRRAAELESARWKRELKLQLLNIGPLLHNCGFGIDLLPVSRLWGKNVLLLLTTHEKFNHCISRLPFLTAKYLEQYNDDNKVKFEIVYVSTDRDNASFEECTKSMPWLVHPYSLEVADMCMSNLFNYPLRSDRYICTIAAAAFGIHGELLAKTPHFLCAAEFPFIFMDDSTVLNQLNIGQTLYQVRPPRVS